MNAEVDAYNKASQTLIHIQGGTRTIDAILRNVWERISGDRPAIEDLEVFIERVVQSYTEFFGPTQTAAKAIHDAYIDSPHVQNLLKQRASGVGKIR